MTNNLHIIELFVMNNNLINERYRILKCRRKEWRTLRNIYKTITKMGICSLVIAGLVFSPIATEAASAKSYQYDNSGRLQSITLSGYKITFTYDKNGNLLKRSVTKTTVAK